MNDFPCTLKVWPEETPGALEHLELPEDIQQAVLAIWQSGDRLHRVITDEGIEWWLLNESGELIETFWLE